jgi:dipeptidyl aminopeptidase/acylaminoacyl peptidase
LRTFFFCAAMLFTLATLHAQSVAKRAVTFDDLIKMHRLADPKISPDGQWVAYAVSTPDMEANRGVSNIWAARLAGGDAVQLTSGGHDSSPVWSPDGKTLAFISSRDGNAQIYLLPMDGGEAREITHASTGVDIVKFSPDGKTLAFTSSVYPDCKDDACNSARDEEKGKSKVKAHVSEQLLYRHWTHWSEGKRAHLFVVPSDASAAPHDLTPGANYDVPPDERGSADDINFSPDGRELCFTAVTDKVEATSTNGDLFLVSVAGGEPKRVTSNPGFDGAPTYSPDGRWIAYHAQLTAGYESDRWRIMLYDRRAGKATSLTDNFDRSAAELLWSADSKAIIFTTENETLNPVYSIAAQPGAEPKKLIADSFNSNVSLSADGKTLAFARTSLTMPAEVFAANADGSNVRQLSHTNDAALATLQLSAPETFWFDATDGTKIQAMLVPPPDFDAAKKYPLLVLLHGGPETMWSNAWSYRWNPEVFSSFGYVTLMINRRGSTGYGQKFTDEISGDWGGKAYGDVMTGVDYAFKK